MSWFKKAPKSDELEGWRIQVRRNEALGKEIYRVLLPGFFSPPLSRAPRWEDFDNYEDALKFYHEQSGWELTTEVQP